LKKTNDYLWDAASADKKDATKEIVISIVEDNATYKSKPQNIFTIGVSGQINLERTYSKEDKDKGDKDNKQFQYQIAISQGLYPFNKTTIVSIVPNYLIINKLSYPILIR
jgi:hypothetical protein